MSNLISRSHFTLPPRGSPARLPFVLVPLLALVAVVQLALPVAPDLPAGTLPARIAAGAAIPAQPLVSAPAVLAGRDPFVPVAPAAKTANGAPPPPPDPLDGAVVAGLFGEGRSRIAMIVDGHGQVRRGGIGSRVGGWHIVALSATGARLARGSRTLSVAYGAHPTPPPARPAANTADDQ